VPSGDDLRRADLEGEGGATGLPARVEHAGVRLQPARVLDLGVLTGLRSGAGSDLEVADLQAVGIRDGADGVARVEVVGARRGAGGRGSRRALVGDRRAAGVWVGVSARGQTEQRDDPGEKSSLHEAVTSRERIVSPTWI